MSEEFVSPAMFYLAGPGLASSLYNCWVLMMGGRRALGRALGRACLAAVHSSLLPTETGSNAFTRFI